MSREQIHDKIDELLASISIQNSRLSLHAERLSHLDIDVLRKYCIDLYDQVNTLAIQGKLATKPEPAPKVKATPSPEPIIVEPIPAPEPVAKIKEIEKPKPEPIAKEVAMEISTEEKEEPVVKPKEVSQDNGTKPKYKQQARMDAEISSLFEKFSSQPISSIPKAISIAKRFEFQSEFFDGNAKAYNTFMAALDAATDRDDAFRIYHQAKEASTWENEDLRDELKALMYRRFT